MKKIQQIIIMLAVLICAAAGNDAKAQTDEVCVAVSPTKFNVLYCGVENPLDIAVAGYKSEDIQVSISQGTISNVEGFPGSYKAIINNPGYADIVISHEGKTLATKRFRAKLIPNPTATVGNKHTGAIFSKMELLAQPMVKVMVEDFDFEVIFRVVSFTLSVTIDGETKSESSTSAAFTSAQKQLLNQAQSGSKVYIFDIKAKGIDGREYDVIPLTYELK